MPSGWNHCMPVFDLFVIGGGSGGVACARRAAAHGARVGLAESSRVGGTCVIRGCVPKKLMHYGAHFAEIFEAAAAYGWHIGRPELDFRTLIEARNKEIARLNGVYLQMLERSGVALFPARARLGARTPDGLHTVEVAGERHQARHVLVSVGGRPVRPQVPGIEHAIASDQVLEDLYDFPERFAVVGAGYIGVELSSIFNALGAETSLVLRAFLPLRGFDEDLRQELTTQLREHGLKIEICTVVERIERTGSGIVLHTKGDAGTGRLEVDAVLYATGRAPIPNTRDMGLEELGVRMNPEGAIVVDEGYQSNVPGILAVGDCSDNAGKGIDSSQFDLTPIAIAEGRHVAERLFNGRILKIAYDTVPTAVFGLPQAGSIGLSEQRAREKGFEIEIYRTRFRPMFHTLTGFERRTMMKLVVDKATGRVLGCHMVGDDAAEIVQGFAVAMTAGATKAEFDATVALHPSAAEEFVTMYQPVA
jgi:glutathione reductase (NADPH)